MWVVFVASRMVNSLTEGDCLWVEGIDVSISRVVPRILERDGYTFYYSLNVLNMTMSLCNVW